MGLVSNWVEKRISNVVSKTSTVTLSAPNSGLLQVINGWIKPTQYVDLATFLKWYETNPLVFEVIDNIDQAVSKIPLKVENSKGIEVKNSQILSLLPTKLRSKIVTSVESCGNGFLYYAQGIGMGGEVDFWVASCVTITTNTKTGQITKYEYQDPNKSTVLTVKGDDLKFVLHIKNTTVTNNLPVNIGMSKLQPMKDVVESSKEKFTADTAMVRNGGVKGIVSNRNSEYLYCQTKERNNKQHSTQEQRDQNKFGGLYVTANTIDFTPIGSSASDLKILEGITENLRRLASAYHLSSVLFNDVANSKFDNMEEAIKQAYINCYIPTSEKIYTPIFLWLSVLLNVDEVPSVDKTQIEVIKGSTNKAAMVLKAFDVQIQRMLVGQFTSEEVREIFDKPPLTSTQTAIGLGTTNTAQNEGGN
jgi:phage portal protein BeeE